MHDTGQTTRFLSGAMRGDSAALDGLALRLRPVLEVMARARLPAALRHRYEPDDLVQDVWVVALGALGDIRARNGRRTPVVSRYLRSTMDLRIRTLLRREIRRRTLHAEVAPEQLDGVARDSRESISRIGAREIASRICAHVEALDEPKREIVLLRGIEQRPNHEVAALLGMPANTVAKIYQRQLRALRERWPESVFAEIDA